MNDRTQKRISEYAAMSVLDFKTYNSSLHIPKQEPSIVIDWGDLETMRTTKPNLQRYLIQDMVSMNPESAALLKTVALESGNGSAAGAT